MNGVVNRDGGGACAWRDSAATHVLGALSPEASAGYVKHLDACDACRSELAQAQADVALADETLALEALERADAPAAPASVRDRLLARVARPAERDGRGLDRTWRRWDATPPAGASTEGLAEGMYALGGQAGAWEPIGIPGIEVKRLAVDPARRMATMLVRMAAGSSYPPHRHAANEECFVLSGDLRVGERELRAGDFQISHADSVHPVQSTREGCLLYISSSQDDELV